MGVRSESTRDTNQRLDGKALAGDVGCVESQNAIIAGTVAHGNETDYAYDTNGNTVAVELPMVQTTAGYLRLRTVLSYDAHSNVLTYNNGVGAWTLAYDTLNRKLSVTDPTSISSSTVYNNDGTVQISQSPVQRAHKGDIIFQLPKSRDGYSHRGNRGGYKDKYGNEWEWDVQHPDGSHTNVNPEGEKTHGKNDFKPGPRNSPRKP